MPVQGNLLFTLTGVSESDDDPFPSCPLLLAPQQYAVPSTASPHVWFMPALMLCHAIPLLLTGTAVVRLMAVPSPSCPRVFAPQQYASPAVLIAQVWFAPALTLAQVT